MSCGAPTLEKQAAGCLAVALAGHFGEAADARQVRRFIEEFGERFAPLLIEKAKAIAETVRIRQGICLGSDSDHPSEASRDIANRVIQEMIDAA
jgi:hypothetical protein